MKTLIKIPKSEFLPEQTLLGGQSFVWEKLEQFSHEIYVGKYTNFLVVLEEKEKYFHVKTSDCNSFDKKSAVYMFRTDVDYKKQVDFLLSDKYIANVASNLYGLNVIRQSFWETAATFVLSSNNTIKNIRNSTQKLSRLYGRKVNTEYGVFYLFPGPEKISKLSVDELKKASLGFRAKYLKELAIQFSRVNPEISSLKRIKGIGDKIADCIMVFTGNADNISPIDVWAKRILKNLYGVEFRKYDEYRQWFASKFGNLAYLAGQFLFEGYRNHITK